MIKNGLAEGMVTRKLCMEILDLVLTSFQTSFFSAPTVSKVQITDMLLLSTSFFSYPLPRSHRQGGFAKKKFPSTSYCFLFQIKAAAHIHISKHQRNVEYLIHWILFMIFCRPSCTLKASYRIIIVFSINFGEFHVVCCICLHVG